MKRSNAFRFGNPVLSAAIATFLWAIGVPIVTNAQEATPHSSSAPSSAEQADHPNAVTLSVLGHCEYSDDGVTFSTLEKGHVCEQGTVIRTADGARTDLFFRRMGTTVRVQAGSEVKLEKMVVNTKDGLPVVFTLLDLHAGRIFTVVRSVVAGSTLEIRNAAGRSVVEGSGIGRYIITADGTHVTATGSAIPLKLIRESGVTVVEAGQEFDQKEGKAFVAPPTQWVKEMIELDELQAAMEAPEAKVPSPKR